MTRTTVQVERTVHDEESVDICDGCGGDETQGELKTYTGPQKSNNKDSPLHFHETCLEEIRATQRSSESRIEKSKSYVDTSKKFLSNFKEGFLKALDSGLEQIEGNEYIKAILRIFCYSFFIIYFPYLFPLWTLYEIVENDNDTLITMFFTSVFLIAWLLVFLIVDLTMGMEILFHQYVNAEGTRVIQFTSSWIDAYFNHIPVVSWF